jgi:hypothetical protein
VIFRYWHNTDMLSGALNVRFQGQSDILIGCPMSVN